MSATALPPASMTGQATTTDPISPQQEQLRQLKDEAKGATVHSFDPDATPTEKAQQITGDSGTRAESVGGGGGGGGIGKMDMSGLPSVRGSEYSQFKSQGGAEGLSSDLGTSGESIKLTTGLKEVENLNNQEQNEKEVDPVEKARQSRIDEGRLDPQDGTENPPGAMPTKEPEPQTIREIPSWFQIGWTGQDRSLFLTPEEKTNRAILQDFLSDAYYGQWYHNAGIMVFCVVSTHFLTLFGAGWGWMIVILAVCATYYQTSVRRVRRNVRDDMAREVAKKGLKSDVESATWINLFLQRFWLIYEPVLSQTIVASVDQVLSVSTPAFLDSIRMTTFTLGTKPPHLDHVRTFPDTEDDIVLMEMKLSFVPNDVLDMTHAQSARKVNPKIVLNVRFGVGPAKLGKDIIVEDLMFTGVIRIKLKLVNNFPHIQTVDLSFMQPPSFDFVLKPVGFDLSILPGLTPFITSTVHSILGPMMYDPNSFTLNLEQLLSGAPLDTAIGVLAITVHNGRGIKSTKLGGGNPDPYISFAINGRAELARTSTCHSTATPRWKNETKYILLNNLNETLTMTVFDENLNRSDSNCGVTLFDLKTLEQDGEQTDVSGEIQLEGKPRGRIRFDAVFSPVLIPKKLPDGTLEPVPETSSGVVRLVVHAGKDLDSRGRAINPFFKVTLNDRPIHRSQTLKRTPNPIWERPTEFLVTSKPSAVIGLEVMDDNSILSDSRLGIFKIKLQDVLESNKKGNDWFPLSNCRSGKVRITAEWKPVVMPGAINGAALYTPPIGVVRFWFKRSTDLKNVELKGKSDPYVRVLYHGVVVARTTVHDNNLNPEYDEIVYVQVHSTRDVFPIEVMDYQSSSKDRSLGNILFPVAPLISEGPDKVLKPWVSTGKVHKKEGLKSDWKKPVKGNIEFEAEFFPCANLKDVSFKIPDPNENRITEELGTERGSSIAETATSDINETTTTTWNTNNSSATNTQPGTPKVNGNKSVDLSRTASVNNNKVKEGISMTKPELLKHQTGVLAFQIISGNIAKKGARLEVLFDDGYWPAYSTEPSRSHHTTWDEIGEVVVRELDFSMITFQLNSAEKETREDVISQATMDLPSLLEDCLDKVATITLEPVEVGHSKSTITLMAKYIPIEMEILPRESIKNAGILQVKLFGAQGLPSADRNGKSDPYAVFELNGTKVFKSQIKKKTLSPEWNESFDCPVPRRDNAELMLEIWDWDRLGGDDKLAKALIDLSQLNGPDGKLITSPLTLTVDLLDFKSTSRPAGTAKVSIFFRPEFVRTPRRSTGTVSGALGRIGTTLGGGALAVGGGVIGAGGAVLSGGGHAVQGVGKVGIKGVTTVGKTGFAVGKFGVKGVGKGVGTVGKGVVGGARLLTGHARTKSGEVVPIALDEDGKPIVDDHGNPLVIDSTTGSVIGSAEGLESLAEAPTTNSTPEGTLRIQVGKLDGVGEDGEKKAVLIKLNGGKTILETHSHKGDGNGIGFNDSTTVKAQGGEPLDLEISVVHKKRLGSDHVLGSASVNALEYVNQFSPEQTINLPISGPSPGNLELILSFHALPQGLPGAPSVSEYDARSIAGSTAGGSIIGSPSPKSRSRFSSFGRHKAKESTPQPE
ncbi:hypothetical protein JCM3765_004810 [Sporobolomyces pararoseus]